MVLEAVRGEEKKSLRMTMTSESKMASRTQLLMLVREKKPCMLEVLDRCHRKVLLWTVFIDAGLVIFVPSAGYCYLRLLLRSVLPARPLLIKDNLVNPTFPNPLRLEMTTPRTGFLTQYTVINNFTWNRCTICLT